MESNEIAYKKSPIKAIRAKCVECFGGQSNEVKNCTGIKCPLYPYRFGKNPYIQKRELTDDERAQLRARMQEIHKLRIKREDNE